MQNEMKPEHIADLGRIKIVFIGDSQPRPGTIRVIHSATGECLREDRVEDMTEAKWHEIVESYKKMIK